MGLPQTGFPVDEKRVVIHRPRRLGHHDGRGFGESVGGPLYEGIESRERIQMGDGVARGLGALQLGTFVLVCHLFERQVLRRERALERTLERILLRFVIRGIRESRDLLGLRNGSGFRLIHIRSVVAVLMHPIAGRLIRIKPITIGFIGLLSFTLPSLPPLFPLGLWRLRRLGLRKPRRLRSLR